MRVAIVVSVLVPSVLTSILAAAQPVGLPLPPRDVVALVYDDATIPDGDRAQLVKFIASVVPVEKWLPVSITEPSHIDAVIDDYYDYFPIGKEFATPETVAALRKILIDYNALGAVTTIERAPLRLPPFPLHAYHRGRPQTERRLFDVTSRAYRITQLATDQVPNRRNTINGVFGRSKRSSNNSPIDRGHQEIADIVSTTILVPASRTDVMKLSRALSMPRQVLIFNTTLDAEDGTSFQGSFRTGFSSVDVLRREDPCADGAQWLAASPYFQQWSEQNRGAQLDDDALLQRAKDLPLHVLDVNFSGGHGAEVLAVTTQLLNQLGFHKIANAGASTVIPWELVPSTVAKATESQGLIDDYRREYRAAESVLAKFDTETTAWLNTMPSTKIGSKFDIPDLMLGALMWKTFTQQRWVNVSSRVRAPFLSDIVDQVVLDSSGALFAAVGNDSGELQAGYVPQDHQRFPQVVTVTCGTKTGEICGEHSSGSKLRRVLLTGPGCGFAGTSGTGSSLATPYIAVASWLQHLIAQRAEPADSAEINAQLRRHDLLAANVPAPMMAKRVESYGFFDPAYLLLRPAPHVVMKDRTIREISSYTFDFACPENVRGSLTPPSRFDNVIDTLESAQNVTITMLVYPRADGPYVWVRQIVGDGTQIAYNCHVQSLNVTLEMAGRAAAVYDLDTFVRDVAWITWTPYRQGGAQ
jgi:hypothetical protein